MDIKQNHYSTNFENGAIRVDGMRDVMSSDRDSELEGHCKKVTKLRATYESNMATEHGLIEIGKHMSAKETGRVSYANDTIQKNNLQAHNRQPDLRQ
jgi:hypothetical protein